MESAAFCSIHKSIGSFGHYLSCSYSRRFLLTSCLASSDCFPIAGCQIFEEKILKIHISSARFPFTVIGYWTAPTQISLQSKNFAATYYLEWIYPETWRIPYLDPRSSQGKCNKFNSSSRSSRSSRSSSRSSRSSPQVAK